MLLSKEFIKFLNSQENLTAITNFYETLCTLKTNLSTIKEELANSLPSLFMDGDQNSIKQCIEFGNEIDLFINELNSINIKPISLEKQTYKKDTSINQIEDINLTIKPIRLGVVAENVCPSCNTHLDDTKTMYTVFKDKTKKSILEKLQVFTYRCPNCCKYFVHQEMLQNIDIEITNIEPVYFNKENNVKKCIQCGEPVFNNSNYCWEHYKYHNAESK